MLPTSCGAHRPAQYARLEIPRRYPKLRGASFVWRLASEKNLGEADGEPPLSTMGGFPWLASSRRCFKKLGKGKLDILASVKTKRQQSVQDNSEAYVFYYRSDIGVPENELGLRQIYRSCLWVPSLLGARPQGLPLLPFFIWWLLHHSRLFANRDYAVFVIYHDDTVVHRSCVFPGYFRFPFMSHDDLQIGDTWTAPEHRGKGLGTFAVQQVTSLLGKPRRGFWYVVEGGNAASIRVVEKAGFTKVGLGTRTRRLGSRLLGSYIMTTPLGGALGRYTQCQR